MKTFHDHRFIFSLALNSFTYKRFHLLDKQHCYCKAYISKTFCKLGIGCQKKNRTSLSQQKKPKIVWHKLWMVLLLRLSFLFLEKFFAIQHCFLQSINTLAKIYAHKLQTTVSCCIEMDDIKLIFI